MAAANIFISYAHADNESIDPAKRWLDRIVKHLKPLAFQNIISIATDQDTDLGQDWHEKIQEGLNRASAAVLLVSPDFLASTYIRNNELPVLLYCAKEKGLKIIPVILRPCMFSNARFKYPDPQSGPNEFKLSSLQAAGSPHKALNEMDEGEQDRALLSVAQSLLKYAKDRESQIVPTKSESPLDIDESTPNATAQARNGVRLFGRDQLLATVSTALKVHDALLLYGMRGNGKTEFIRALGRLSPLNGKEFVRIRASSDTTPEELYRQIAPLLGDTAEHPKIPEQLMQPQVGELPCFPNARSAWVWIDCAHQLLTPNSWKNQELERLIRSLRKVLGQKWHWILELRERPPVGLMGKGCVEYEIPGLDKASLSACIASSSPQGQTVAWTYQGDNLKRLYQWLGGGHGEQAHPLTTHLLIEVARGLHLTPLQVRERHINDVVQEVENSLLNDLFEAVLSPPEQKLLQALALYRDAIPHDHAEHLERKLDTPGAWLGLDHRCLLASDVRHERYYLHGFIAGWLRSRLGYAGDPENDEADFDRGTKNIQRELAHDLHSAIADCWLNQLAGSCRPTLLNVERALESFHHLLCAGDSDKITNIAITLLGGHEEWARQRLWGLCNHLHHSKASSQGLRNVLEFIIRLDPSDHKAYRFLGENFIHEEGRGSLKALEYFKKACYLRDDFPPYWADFGNSAAVVGGDEAQAFLDRLDAAIKIHPNAENEVVIFAKSQCLVALGQHDVASTVRMNQIQGGIRHPQTFAAEIGYRRLRNELENALELIVLSKKRGCYDLELRARHAEILHDLGDLKTAATYRKECIAEGILNSSTYVDEAVFLLSEEQPDAAIKVLEHARTLGLKDDHITAVLARAYQATGKGDKASTLRMQQINNGNSNPVLFSDEIKWLRDNKRTPDALALYLLAKERDAVNSHVLANHTTTLQIVGRVEEASRIRIEQIDQGSKEAAFYNDEAFWQIELNQPELARDLMKLAKERGAYDAYSDSVMKEVEKRLGKQSL